MDKYINANLVKKLLVFKTKKHPDWIHCVKDYRFLFWKVHKNYWYHWDPYYTYTEEKLLSVLDNEHEFYKNGEVYQKPHIILKLSDKYDESVYFDSDEEMEGWLESFKQEFGKSFIYIN